MASTGELQAGDVETLDVPSENFVVKNAFSMDIGGSMTKIVYAKDEGANVKLHFISYPRNRTKEALDLLKGIMGGRQPDGTTMRTCGVGFQEYADYIRDELNIIVQVTEEITCFAEAFRYMTKHVPFDDLVHADPPNFREMVNMLAEPLMGAVNLLASAGIPWQLAPEEEEVKEFKYPLMMCMLGSGGAPFIMFEDGTFKTGDVITRCGRYLMGLANLLIGVTSFTELIELASQGNDDNLHVKAKHLKMGAEDVYAPVPDEFMVYAMGQAMGRDKDSFNREDIAATLISTFAGDLAQCIHQVAMVHGVKQIFMTGSVVGTSQYMRNHINMVLSIRGLLNSKVERSRSYFMRFAGYYGAIGALLRTMRGDPNANDK